MKIKSGIAYMGKKDIEALNTLIRHANTDMRFGCGGTYGDGETFDAKEIKKGERGIELIRAIFEQLIKPTK